MTNQPRWTFTPSPDIKAAGESATAFITAAEDLKPLEGPLGCWSVYKRIRDAWESQDLIGDVVKGASLAEASKAQIYDLSRSRDPSISAGTRDAATKVYGLFGSYSQYSTTALQYPSLWYHRVQPAQMVRMNQVYEFEAEAFRKEATVAYEDARTQLITDANRILGTKYDLTDTEGLDKYALEIDERFRALSHETGIPTTEAIDRQGDALREYSSLVQHSITTPEQTTNAFYSKCSNTGASVVSGQDFTKAVEGLLSLSTLMDRASQDIIGDRITLEKDLAAALGMSTFDEDKLYVTYAAKFQVYKEAQEQLMQVRIPTSPRDKGNYGEEWDIVVNIITDELAGTGHTRATVKGMRGEDVLSRQQGISRQQMKERLGVRIIPKNQLYNTIQSAIITAGQLHLSR